MLCWLWTTPTLTASRAVESRYHYCIFCVDIVFELLLFVDYVCQLLFVLMFLSMFVLICFLFALIFVSLLFLIMYFKHCCLFCFCMLITIGANVFGNVCVDVFIVCVTLCVIMDCNYVF